MNYREFLELPIGTILLWKGEYIQAVDIKISRDEIMVLWEDDWLDPTGEIDYPTEEDVANYTLAREGIEKEFQSKW